MRRRPHRYPAALLAALGASSALSAAEPALTDASGTRLFAQFCVSCHGVKGVGDGPVASALKIKPADLTVISAGAGGVFPEVRVREMIDGRAVTPAHGTREMPVWGYELEASGADRAAAQSMTDRLVEYLRTIQK